jgi:hypothetical protein
VGLLSVGSQDGQELGERDLTVLRAIADRVAAALALSLQREIIASRGRRFSRVSVVARELGAAAPFGDDAAFWATLGESAGGALSSKVIILGFSQDPDGGSHWQELARSGADVSTDLEASVLAVADSALAEGSALDDRDNMAAVRLSGWRHPVALISVGGSREGPVEALVQLATAVEPILRLRVAVADNAPAGQALLSAFSQAIDWAVAQADGDGASPGFMVVVVESLDDAVDSAQLVAAIRADSRLLVAALSQRRVGIMLETRPAGRSTGAAADLVSTLARTRSVLGGTSTIGPDLAAAAFERASGALELARRLGPGNTVAA